MQLSDLISVAPRYARSVTRLSIEELEEVQLLAVFGPKADLLAGREQPAHRLQTQLFCSNYADAHYPA
jgi:hypothetical protein